MNKSIRTIILIDLTNVKVLVMEAAKMVEGKLVRYFHEAKEVGDLSPPRKRLFVKYNTSVPNAKGGYSVPVSYTHLSNADNLDFVFYL